MGLIPRTRKFLRTAVNRNNCVMFIVTEEHFKVGSSEQLSDHLDSFLKQCQQ